MFFSQKHKIAEKSIGRLHKIYSETAASFVQNGENNFRQVAQLCNMHKKTGKIAQRFVQLFPWQKPWNVV